MPNMKSRINIHNKKVTKAKPSAQARTCNCINKSKCPLNNKCLSNNVLYLTNIKSTTENYRNKIYYGISETKFKSRYANHWKSFKNRKYKTDNELPNEIWNLKEQNRNIDISWEILGIHQLYNTSTKRCNAMSKRKLVIALYKKDNILNKRNENIKAPLSKDPRRVETSTLTCLTSQWAGLWMVRLWVYFWTNRQTLLCASFSVSLSSSMLNLFWTWRWSGYRGVFEYWSVFGWLHYFHNIRFFQETQG